MPLRPSAPKLRARKLPKQRQPKPRSPRLRPQRLTLTGVKHRIVREFSEIMVNLTTDPFRVEVHADWHCFQGLRRDAVQKYFVTILWQGFETETPEDCQKILWKAVRKRLWLNRKVSKISPVSLRP